MDTKIKLVGTLDGVKLFFDPLRKPDVFILNINDEPKNGVMIIPFIELENGKTIMKENDAEAMLESGVTAKWENVSSIIAGFDKMNLFNKIKECLV